MIRSLRFNKPLAAILAVVILIGLTAAAFGQRKPASKRARTVDPKPDVMAADTRTGAVDVGIQIKNVTKFLFVLGGVATGIEEIEREVRAGKASRELRVKNDEFKENIIRSITALRAGLVKLEIDFRVEPALKPYLPHIQGIIDDTARAEDYALDGQFNESGKQLLLVIERLTDVLVEMP